MTKSDILDRVWRYRLVLILALMVLILILGVINREAITDGLTSRLLYSGFGVGLIISIALWFFVTQLVLLPAGTLSIVVASAVLGWWMGVIYAVAMVGAAAVLFPIAAHHPQIAKEQVERWLANERWLAAGRLILRQIQRHTTTSTIALRLLPIMPSAACTMVVAVMGGDKRHFLIGTILAGWVRPLAFGLVGAGLGDAWRDPVSLAEQLSRPTLIVAILSLALASAAQGLLVLRARRSGRKTPSR